jgi:hypothetical protein
MPRRRLRDWPIRVYTYGVRLGPAAYHERWPVALAQVIEAQHALWNQLVACFERHREHYEALLQAHETLAPLRLDMEATQAQYSAYQQAEKAARQRCRRTQPPEASTLRLVVAEAYKHAKAARQAYRAAMAAHRDQLRPQHTALLDTLWAEAESLSKAAPLAWYNQRLISDSFRRAVERFLRSQGGPPKRKQAITQAHLTYHFSRSSLTWERLLGGKTSMLHIVPVPERVWDETLSQSVRRKAARTTATLRISDTDSLTFRVTLMRRPPPGTLIKSAELVGREVMRRWGQAHSRWDWELALVCEIPPATIPRREPLRQAALDLGWRVLDDKTIRVGMLWDGTQCTALHFPAQLTARWRHVQSLQRQVAEALTVCKATLETVWQGTPLPEDLQSEAWAQVGQRGLLRLLRAVQALPAIIPSRAATLAVLEPWERRTGKLWREARGLQGHLVRAKQAWYRVIAKEICTQYDVLAIAELHLRQMSQRRPAMSLRLQASMAYRQLVAPGAFLQRLTHTAAREGVQVIKVDSTYSTLTCPICEAVLPSQDGELWLTCPHGHRYDQDRGAAITLFHRAFARGENSSREGRTS